MVKGWSVSFWHLIRQNSYLFWGFTFNKIGHFDVSSDENLILFRQALLLSGEARINETQALALVDAAVKACDTYFQSFQFVLWAGRSPREAIDFAMFETIGRAWEGSYYF